MDPQVNSKRKKKNDKAKRNYELTGGMTQKHVRKIEDQVKKANPIGSSTKSVPKK
jgi:hypothetical protein